MRSPQLPVTYPRFEPTVCNPIDAATIRDHSDIIQKALTCLRIKNMELVSRSDAVVNDTGVLNLRPDRLLRLVTAFPVHGQPVVAFGIDQFKTAAPAITPSSPTIPVRIGHIIHQYKVDKWLIHVIWHRQCDSLATVRKGSLVVPPHDLGGQLRITGDETIRVFRHHQVFTGLNHRARWDHICNTIRKLPMPHVHRLVTLVVQFNILVYVETGKGMIHDLINDNIMGPWTAV